MQNLPSRPTRRNHFLRNNESHSGKTNDVPGTRLSDCTSRDVDILDIDDNSQQEKGLMSSEIVSVRSLIVQGRNSLTARTESFEKELHLGNEVWETHVDILCGSAFPGQSMHGLCKNMCRAENSHCQELVQSRIAFLDKLIVDDAPKKCYEGVCFWIHCKPSIFFSLY